MRRSETSNSFASDHISFVDRPVRTNWSMISKKKEVKQIHEGVAGKYVKKENPPEIPSMNTRLISFLIDLNLLICFFYRHT